MYCEDYPCCGHDENECPAEQGKHYPSVNELVRELPRLVDSGHGEKDIVVMMEGEDSFWMHYDPRRIQVVNYDDNREEIDSGNPVAPPIDHSQVVIYI